MKKKLLITSLLCGFTAILTAQIKIGDNPQNIDAASVLELESTDRVLVITRVNTSQMNAINPNQGAMVYNTDEQCIFYYDGGVWQNLCVTQELILTADAITNTYPSITITENGDERNIEVLEVRGENIGDESITEDDLQADSVGSDELQPISVSDEEMDYDNVTLIDFTNDTGYITSAQVVSSAAGNDIIDSGGAFYDDSVLQNGIAVNAAAIAADMDGDPTNEIELPIGGNNGQVLSTDGAGIYSWIDNGGGAVVVSADTPNSIIAGTDGGALYNDPDADPNNEIELPTGGIGGQVLSTDGAGTYSWIDNAGGAVVVSADTPNSIIAGTDGGALYDDPDANATNEIQDLASVLVQGTDAGASLITNVLDPVAAQDVATKAYVDANAGGTIVSADSPNSIIAGTDGGALYDDPDADATNEIQDLASVLVQGTDAGASLITNVLDPVAAQDVATKAYVDANAGGHTGTTGSIFFADAATGAPTENNPSLFWDETARFNTGALGVGIDGNTFSDRAKVHFMEQLPGNIAFPLQLQNNTQQQTGHDNDQSTVALLFAVEALGAFGKGALAFERTGTFGRGSFHFLQDSGANTDNPDINDAVVTITSAGDMGVGTTTPNSTFEVAGSSATQIRSSATGAVIDDDHTVIFISTAAVTLPLATTCTGRIYVLKNVTGVALVIDNYLDSLGITSNSLPTGVTWLQSDGINWHQIN